MSLDKYTIVERDEIHCFYNWLQHYSSEQLTAELGENGFEVVEIYSNVAGDPDDDSPVIAVVAQLV